MAGTRFTLFLVTVLAFWCCCLSFDSYEDWSVNIKYTPSSSSRFYILNDWQNTYSQEENVAPLPAAKVSDIMLKTMGILRDGANWPGVLLGNLFSRPLATALFVVDGIATESGLGELSSTSFPVDQTGLVGCTCSDTRLMFKGDNVAQHLSDLFEQDSMTSSVSANIMAAELSSANGAFTVAEHLQGLMEDIQNGQLSLAAYGLEAAATELQPKNEVDARFIAELVLIHQTVEQLTELASYAKDASPDVFIFTISALQSVEERYGAGSSEMGVATKLVKQVIQGSSVALAKLYNGRVLVQALVLEWDHPVIDKEDPELQKAFHLLRPYLQQERLDSFVSSLPHLAVKEEHNKNVYLCTNLRYLLQNSKFYAKCPLPSDEDLEEHGRTLREAKSHTRKKRDAPADVELAAEETVTYTFSNATISDLAENRSNLFSAIFLITLFVTVSLGLSVFAVSWALWNMDPGRDSVIYRLVADPTVRMQ